MPKMIFHLTQTLLLPNYGISPIFEMAILAKNLPI